MECDFGYPFVTNDDFVQDYSSFNEKSNWWYQEEKFADAYEEYQNICEPGNPNQTKLSQKQAKKERKQLKRAKKQARRERQKHNWGPQVCLQSYFRIVLSWKFSDIMKNSRESLCLPRLEVLPELSTDKCNFYNYMTHLIIEETRCSLYNSGISPMDQSSKMTMTLNKSQIAKGFRYLYFTVINNNIGCLLAGHVYKLSCYKKDNLSFENNMILAIIPRARAAIAAHEKKIVLMAHELHHEFVQSHINFTWEATPLTSLSSYNRMYAACLNEPYPPFFNTFLNRTSNVHSNNQNRSSTHVKFDDEGMPIDNTVASSVEHASRNVLEEVAESKTSDTSIETLTRKRPHLEEAETMPKRAKTSPSIYSDTQGQPTNHTQPTINTFFSLNRSQGVAMEKCVTAASSDGSLVIVQGPPGCGKTYFLVSLVRELLARNLRVMVCAPSNKAVCVALELYLTSYASVTPSVEEELARDCVLVGVEDKLESSSTLADSESDTENHDWLVRPRRAMDVFAYAFGPRLAAELAITAKTASFLVTEYHNLSSKGILAGMVSKLKTKIVLLLQHLSLRCPATLKKCKVKSMFENELLPALEGAIDQEVLRNLHRHLLTFSADLETKATLPRELIKRAKVVFCTLSSAGQGALRSMTSPDILLVDEAGQSLEAELAVPFLLHPRSMVLVGDPKQLPATLLSFEAQRLGYGRSSMQRLMSPESSHPHPHVLLDTQYRMDPDISSFPNHRFYDGKLINSDKVIFRNNVLITTATRYPKMNWLKPYVFLNISSPESGGGHSSIYNLGEANLISKYVSIKLF